MTIQPKSIVTLKDLAKNSSIASFWGHDDTVALVSTILDVDIRPRTSRPALTLSAEGFPMLDGLEYSRCWIVSPDYKPGFRPHLGDTVGIKDIQGWFVLEMAWD